MQTHRFPPLAAAALLLAAAPAGAQARDSAALVTLLGNDTVAVERWVRTGNRWEAAAAVRSPSASLRRYTLETDASGAMRRWEERFLDPANPAGAPTRTETLEAVEGGWMRTVAAGDSTRAARVEAPATALPFVDLVHWPLELALARVPASGQAPQPLLAGGRAIPFTVARTGAGEVTVTHPLRGPSVVRVDGAGRLQRLDAAQTTRKVVVTRVPWADVEGPAARWAAADRAGRGMGELSGRATESFEVGGARITLDYGVPVRRGRDIWGAVVPWGRVWRTGANRATHLTTTRDLVVGGLAVPAGSYTLFSIPEENGGVLIINRQTGQNGTAYDSAQDLGRVPMRRVPRAEPAERFAISADSGALRLVWDRSEFVVPLTVR